VRRDKTRQREKERGSYPTRNPEPRKALRRAQQRDYNTLGDNEKTRKDENPMMNYFYEKRASDDTPYFCMEEYEEHRHSASELSDKLNAMLTDEQWRLYLELDAEITALGAIANRETYKVGLTDGIALGFVGATHNTEIEAARKESFRSEYVDGKMISGNQP
jgi:hypothetical protein